LQDLFSVEEEQRKMRGTGEEEETGKGFRV